MSARFYLIFLALVIQLVAYGQPWKPYPERHKRLVQSIGFSPDGTVLYFCLMHREYLQAMGEKVDDKTPLLAIYQAQKTEEGWGNPQLLSFSGDFKDYEPTLSPDGKYLFFNSQRLVDGVPVGKLNNIWYSELKENGWSEARYLSEVNTIEFEESYPTITADGKLYFVAGREENGKLNYGLYSTQFIDGNTDGFIKELLINDSIGSGDPWVSPDGTYIIFTKFDDSIGWSESCDLYYSIQLRDGWSKPQPLTELNSEGPDYAVAISPDEEWIYYRKNSQFIRLPFQSILKQMKESQPDGR